MPQVLRVVLVCEQDPTPVLLVAKRVDDRSQRSFEDVVRQHDDAVVAVDEVLGEPERLRNPARLRLVGVEQAVAAVGAPVAEQAQELSRVRASGDDHDLVHSGADERLDRVLDHRPVVDRQQVLVGDARQGVEPRPRAAGEDDSLHGLDATSVETGSVRLRS
jgi:hypothetical protein